MVLTEAERRGVEKYLGDAGAAIERVVLLNDGPVAGRRSIDHAMQAIYRALNGVKHLPGFWARADVGDGRTLQAVIYVRGAMEHLVVADVHESTDEIYPGEHTLPAEDLYHGPQFWWRPWEAMLPHLDPASGQRDKRPLVQATLPGRRVVDTLQIALRHLEHELQNAE